LEVEFQIKKINKELLRNIKIKMMWRKLILVNSLDLVIINNREDIMKIRIVFFWDSINRWEWNFMSKNKLISIVWDKKNS